jgi:hypothetical protein
MRLSPIVALLIGLAGCGGGGERAETERTTPSVPQIRGTSPLVPTEADGPPPKGAARVIRRWAAAVRAADWGRAADLVATGAHVQTGPEVERLTTRNLVLAWNTSLPCGAKVERIGGARGYAIVRFRLTERKEGACREDLGQITRTAIRVADGRIVGWYALN